MLNVFHELVNAGVQPVLHSGKKYMRGGRCSNECCAKTSDGNKCGARVGFATVAGGCSQYDNFKSEHWVPEHRWQTLPESTLVTSTLI